ncbi:MAG: nitrite reductase small subunit NirD [Paracoccaceae bacterium]
MTGWIDIGALEDIPPRGARVVRTRLGCVAVFRTAEDEVFALEDRCPHLGGPLSEGIVHGRSVTCPLHNWVIGLSDGAVESGDAGRVATFSARVDAGRVFLDGDRLADGRAA